MTIDIALIVLGASILVLGLLSAVVRRLWLSVPLAALAVGVLLGPEVLGVFAVDAVSGEHRVLEELARVTLSVSLVATALQFTREDLRENLRRGITLLTVVMLGMWLVTSLGAWLLLGVDPWIALLIGGILTPTDPVVAASIVTGRLAEANLPRWVRRSLQLESGANDGLALVFVLVPALVLAMPGDPAGEIAGKVGTEVALGLVVGLVVGALTAQVVDLAEEHQAVAQNFLFPTALAMALTTLGAAHALGGSGVLASFVAGMTFSLTVGERYVEALQGVQEAFERILVVPVFVVFGALAPWDAWMALGWSGIAFAAWVLILRRPPAAAAALRAIGTPGRGTAFLSWYGPLGVAALYYALFVARYGFEDYDRIFAACTLAIAASVLIHSVTATPGVRLYAGRRPMTTLLHPLTKGVDEAA